MSALPEKRRVFNEAGSDSSGQTIEGWVAGVMGLLGNFTTAVAEGLDHFHEANKRLPT